MAISGERERLRIIRDLLSEPLPVSINLPVRLMLDAGDQDDCAVYDLSDTLSLVVGTDFVRGTGFRLFQEGLLDYFDLGYYLAVANLSDVLSSSVDFELAFTVEQEALPGLLHELPVNTPVHALGMAISPGEQSSLIRHDGIRISPIPGTPWEQQRNDVIDIILGGK